MYLLNPDGSAPTGHTAYQGGYPNMLVYADRPGDVTGSTSCVTQLGKANYDTALHFKKGWNFVQFAYAESGEGFKLSMRTLEATSVILAPAGP